MLRKYLRKDLADIFRDKSVASVIHRQRSTKMLRKKICEVRFDRFRHLEINWLLLLYRVIDKYL